MFSLFSRFQRAPRVRVRPRDNAEAWTMALAAMYLEEGNLLRELDDLVGPAYDQSNHDALREEILGAFCLLDMGSGGEDTAESRALLAEAWDIRDRDSAVATLDFLRVEGHRFRFERMRGAAQLSPPIQNRVLREMDDAREILSRQFQFACRRHRALGRAGILAWDLARYVHVVRLSFISGYLRGEEAWEQAMRAYPVARGAFGSWRGYAASFLAGRAFWRGSYAGGLAESCDRLLGHRLSPWKLIPWAL